LRMSLLLPALLLLLLLLLLLQHLLLLLLLHLPCGTNTLLHVQGQASAFVHTLVPCVQAAREVQTAHCLQVHWCRLPAWDWGTGSRLEHRPLPATSNKYKKIGNLVACHPAASHGDPSLGRQAGRQARHELTGPCRGAQVHPWPLCRRRHVTVALRCLTEGAEGGRRRSKTHAGWGDGHMPRRPCTAQGTREGDVARQVRGLP